MSKEVPAVPQREPMGIAHPLAGKKKRMAFGKLTLDPLTFQVRDTQNDTGVDRNMLERQASGLVADMRKAVLAGVELDPLLVWKHPESGEHSVVDGHHRMGAYREADLKPSAKVWVQLLSADTVAEARAFAFEKNMRNTITMTKNQKINNAWLDTLTGDAEGSFRTVAERYHVSKGSIERIRQQAPAVLLKLTKQRYGRDHQGKPLEASYIREHAPPWNRLTQWLGKGKKERPDLERFRERQVAELVIAFLARFGDLMATKADIVREAFEVFHEDSTGTVVSVVMCPEGLADDDCEEEDEF